MPVTGINAKALHVLMKKIEQNLPTLEVLDISKNHFGDQLSLGCQPVSKSLHPLLICAFELRVLNISLCHFTENDSKCIVSSMKNAIEWKDGALSKIEDLCVSDLSLKSTESKSEFIAVIGKMEHLSTLQMEDCIVVFPIAKELRSRTLTLSKDSSAK